MVSSEESLTGTRLFFCVYINPSSIFIKSIFCFILLNYLYGTRARVLTLWGFLWSSDYHHKLTLNMPENVWNADSAGNNSNIVVQINPVSQLPIKLVGSHNFPTWKPRFPCLYVYMICLAILTAPLPLLHQLSHKTVEKWCTQHTTLSSARIKWSRMP